MGLRSFAIGALFALVLLLPKLVHIRRNKQSWFAFRMILGFAGAALVVLPLSLWNNWIAAPAGLAMFLAAALLPSAKPDTSSYDKARELGARVVVDGGKYQPENAPAASAQLFVGAERIWALDSHLQPLLVIPAAEITSVLAENSDGGWLLRVHWSDRFAEFSYQGLFAEHLARIAESTLGRVMRAPLPVLPRRRAAGA
jgi:hypothetical protein